MSEEGEAGGKDALVREAAAALAAAQEAMRRYTRAQRAAQAAGATSEELHDAREDLRPVEERRYWRDIEDDDLEDDLEDEAR